MKSKNFFTTLLLVMASAMLCPLLTGCGDDDDDDNGGGSGTINRSALVGQTFYKSEQSGGSENIETKKWEVSFKSEYFAHVHVYGSGYDDDGRYSWDNGEADCTYAVKGNTVTIPFSGLGDYSETIVMKFNESGAIGWSGSTVNVFAGGGGDSSQQQEQQEIPAMIGYYTYDGFRQNMRQRAKSKESAGDTNWSNMDEEVMGFRVVDGNTLWQLYEYVSTTRPSSSYYLSLVDNYTVKRQFFSLYFYFDFIPYKEYKYVLDGKKLILSESDMELEFNGGKLYYKSGSNTATFTKAAGYD